MPEGSTERPLAELVSEIWNKELRKEGEMVPVIHKQGMPQNGIKPRQIPVRTGFLSRFVPIEQIAEQPLKICIYGQNRVGKTTWACRLPKPLALISFEPSPDGGMPSVRKVPGVEYVRLTHKDEIEGMARELQVDSHFKSVVCDSATSLEDVVLMNLKGLTERPVQLGFGSVSDGEYIQRSEQAKELIRLFINLPKHVVITAKEKDHVKSDDQKEARTAKLNMPTRSNSFFSAGVGSGFAGWLFDACSHFCRLYVEEETVVEVQNVKVLGKERAVKKEVSTGKNVRKLRTSYHVNYAAGFRSDVPSAIPEWIQLDGTDNDFKSFMEVVNGKRIKNGRYND